MILVVHVDVTLKAVICREKECIMRTMQRAISRVDVMEVDDIVIVFYRIKLGEIPKRKWVIDL
jgi:metal-sulfur cluster biosynthetic enzyme